MRRTEVDEFYPDGALKSRSVIVEGPDVALSGRGAEPGFAPSPPQSPVGADLGGTANADILDTPTVADVCAGTWLGYPCVLEPGHLGYHCDMQRRCGHRPATGGAPCNEPFGHEDDHVATYTAMPTVRWPRAPYYDPPEAPDGAKVYRDTLRSMTTSPKILAFLDQEDPAPSPIGDEALEPEGGLHRRLNYQSWPFAGLHAQQETAQRDAQTAAQALVGDPEALTEASKACLICGGSRWVKSRLAAAWGVQPCFCTEDQIADLERQLASARGPVGDPPALGAEPCRLCGADPCLDDPYPLRTTPPSGRVVWRDRDGNTSSVAPVVSMAEYRTPSA